MAPNQKKKPTKKTKKIAAIKTVKKGASKKMIEKQLEKMGKQHEKLEEKMEEQHEKMEEQVEELKESLEEHVQDGAAHQIEEQLEQLKESLEEHVEDGAAHHFEEQLEKLEERLERGHDKLKDKMEEGEEESEESEDEDGEGSTTSSSEGVADWLRGKMSGLFGSRNHFSGAHSRQVDSENADSDVTEHLHQAYRLGGHWAAAQALWWLEEGSSAHGVHFNQGAVAFQALPREVKENLTERATIIMHRDLLEKENNEKKEEED